MPADVSPERAAVVERIKSEGAVAVIRTDSSESALAIAEAVIAGGFRAIEITYSFPDAAEAIATISRSNKTTCSSAPERS